MAKKARKPGVAEFVLDGSLALAWYFKDEADSYADAHAARFPTSRAAVPVIWPLEVANAVLSWCKGRRAHGGGRGLELVVKRRQGQATAQGQFQVRRVIGRKRCARARPSTSLQARWLVSSTTVMGREPR